MKRLLTRILASWCREMHSHTALLKEGNGYRCQVCQQFTRAPWALTELERVRFEQRLAAAHVPSDGFVACLGACDWMAEELEMVR